MTPRRLLDLAVAIPGAILISPLLLAVAIWIKLDSRGPVFFRQVRVGLHHEPFRIFKFRTMVLDAEKIGGQITPDNDRRITRSGRMLRKLKLDELPQLFNVLAGQMAMVGPRPEVPRYVEMYTDEQRRVLDLKPGITDPASIAFRSEGEILAQSSCPEETYVQIIMPEKVRQNLEYARSATVMTDLRVIFQTIACLFRK